MENGFITGADDNTYSPAQARCAVAPRAGVAAHNRASNKINTLAVKFRCYWQSCKANLHFMSNWRIRLEPLITPIFRTWWRLRRGATLGVRGIASDAEGRVMLVRHTYAKGWHLPGGGVESGETAIEAVLRETAEEAGVEAISAPRLVGFYANHANFPNDHIALYLFETWRHCPPKQDNEIAERGFFARDQLPEGVTKGTRRRLDEIFNSAQISANW